MLLQLGEEGRSEHLQHLGLMKLKEELKFKRMMKDVGTARASTPLPSSTAVAVDRKLTKSDMKCLTREDKATYLIK